MCEVVPGSFRDPSGFLYTRDEILYRQINHAYKSNYDALMDTGLYERLVGEKYLVSHEEVDVEPLDGKVYKIIKPEMVDMISYPSEWAFSQIKDAALLTLNVQKIALDHGMTLKDASAYNVQFINGRPIFIDTLSFEKYINDTPWVAYRQFCQHFLSPLALMAKTDVSLSKLLNIYMDGIPLDLASKLLPFSTYFSLSLGIHIHLHAKMQSTTHSVHSDSKGAVKRKKISKRAFAELIDNLIGAVNKLHWSPQRTEWYDYYENNNNYQDIGLESKDTILGELIAQTASRTCWDLGANTGRYSRIAAKSCKAVISCDVDPACVELNYLELKKTSQKNVLPLLVDVMNPTPAYGWSNEERVSLQDRGPVDIVLALGLVHHLAISNNVPLKMIAHYFHDLARFAIVEFVPKADSQVQKLLQSRTDIFQQYDQENFENEFSKYFDIIESREVDGSERVIYLFRSNQE